MGESCKDSLNVTCGDKDILTYRWEVKKSDTPSHSIVVEVDRCFPNRTVEYGPIPDVLVAELIHELKTSRKQAVQAMVDRLMRGIR